MNYQRPLDLRLADWIIRKLKAYKAKRKKTITQHLWNSSFQGKEFIIHQLDANLQIRLYKDSELNRYIFNGFEKTEINFLQKVLRPGDIFIDVGANIGLFSLYAARAVTEKGTVIAFEPTPEIYRRFVQNIELNDLINIVPVNIGLSDSATTLSLQVSENGLDGWNTFAKNAGNKFTTTIDVPVNTLDNYLKESEISAERIRFIKIDVEGWEIPVIRGALKTINASENIILMVEFTESNASAAGYTTADLYDIITEQGFTWYIYNEHTNSLVPDPKRSSYPYNNLFAIKNISFVNRLLQKDSQQS